MNSVFKYFFVLWLLFSSCLIAQNKKIDSLKSELLFHKQKDTIRVTLLNAIANSYVSINIDTALVFLKETKEILNNLDYTKGKAKSIHINGLIMEAQLNYEEAFKCYKSALELNKKINFQRGISDCLISLGDVRHLQGNDNESIKYLKEAIKFNETTGDIKRVGQAYNSTGIVYSDIENYDEAITYFKKAIKINTQINYKQGNLNCLNNLGVIYSRQGDYVLSLECFKESLSICEDLGEVLKIPTMLMNMTMVYYSLQNYDKGIEVNERALKIAVQNNLEKNVATITSNLGMLYHKKKEYYKAIHFLKNAVDLSKEINFQVQMGFSLNNLGDVYLSLEEYPKAITHFKKAREIHTEISNQLGLTHSYLGIAKVYAHDKAYDEALENALKGKEISITIKLLDYERNIEELLSVIYQNKGKFKEALQSHQQYKILNDSILNKENIEKIAQLEAEYKYKQAIDSAGIRELKLTKTVKSTSQDLEKSQRNYLWAIIGVLLVSILLGSVIFYQKYRNVKTKNEHIVVEQKLLRSQMTPHFIFNSMSVLQGMILNKENGKSVDYLSKFSKLLRITLENSRTKMVVLSQEIEGLIQYLELQNLEDTAYRYTVLVDEGIDASLFKIPPMLIQPFVENAAEHAFKNEQENRFIEVLVKYKAPKLICTVIDNGHNL